MQPPDAKLHADEVSADASLVRRLLAAQLPRWADLTITAVPSAGTDNAIFRLGDDMAVRLPRRPSAVSQVEKEQRWLPRLAPQLPLEIPAPLARGTPAAGYPFPWSVYRWIEGENALVKPVTDQRAAAEVLGDFVRALQQADAADGPSPGDHNSSRGAPLAAQDREARTAIASLHGVIDTSAATAAWERALAAPPWRGAHVWLHGDLLATNLLVRGGRLVAVIDFGCCGVGDPACDVMAAWTFLSAPARDVFRARVRADDATWARARGWALWFGLIALPYYRESNVVLAGIARRAIGEVLADSDRAS